MTTPTQLTQLAEHVYIYERSTEPETVQPNIGLIDMGSETVMVDAGNSPHHARLILGAMSEVGLPPVKTIIYTHYHWDHTFGAATYRPQRIIGHERNPDMMQEYTRQVWTREALNEAIQENPRSAISLKGIMRAIPNLYDFQILLPTWTFRERLTIYYERMPLVCQAVGGRHAPDSIVVKLPKVGVMFLADSYYPPPMSIREAGDDDLHLEMLNQLRDEAYQIYVDGHGEPRSHAEFSQMIEDETKRQQDL